MREITYAEAIREAISQEMRKDEEVFLMGEDIGVYGGAFGVSQGMFEEFGEERIRETPISEAAIVGASVGAASTGMRPIAEIMFSDFTAVAFDQIVNQAAKMRYQFGGQAKVPHGHSNPGRVRDRRRRPAFPESRGMVLPRPRPQGGDPFHTL